MLEKEAQPEFMAIQCFSHGKKKCFSHGHIRSRLPLIVFLGRKITQIWAFSDPQAQVLFVNVKTTYWATSLVQSIGLKVRRPMGLALTYSPQSSYPC